MRTTEVTENLKCRLTIAETLDISRRLARNTKQRSAVDENKKRIAKDMAAEMTTLDGEIDRLSSLVDQGYEYREVKCEVRYNDPEPKMKRIIRTDTAEEVQCVPMTWAELQEELALDNPNPADEPQQDLPLGERVIGIVAEHINGGALDSEGVTVTATTGA